MNKQKSYLGPFVTMVFLFFIVGFLTVVFQQFQTPLREAFLGADSIKSIKNTLTIMVTFAWFLAYPLTGNTGSKWVDRFGYKKTLLRALGVMVIGLLITAGSAYLGSMKDGIVIAGIPLGFFVFLIGSFVVGAAATIMQVVINPYLTACEVKGTSAIQRITIGGSSNSIGTTSAPYFVSGLVFGGASMAEVDINKVIIPFMLLAITIALVVFVVSRLSLPNIEGTTNVSGEKLEKSIWSFSHLKLGVIGIFFYVGVEVAIGANINVYAEWLGGSFAEAAAKMATLYWGGMLVGRLIGSTLSKISAKTQLVVTSVGATVLVLISMISGNPWFLVGIGLLHSIMWGGIFSLAVADLGKYTSKASGALMIGVIGGAILPLLQGMMADALGGNWAWTWTLVILGELYILYYALLGSKVRQKG
ncbi:MFS transporter, FHS family, L-fucose permease [Saccharicrinis carchari]|uniref:MFS transporter, FHS family, L-fucose permease n=1 Tax=Saccharicrinis carchari TaxID=1168039 RepID=A0A521BBU3_SACCC|nr:MFS transporter [Saccharicrinis carchari]SMO44529.1 MFS transporter, FHS family, L-fucose permease [Saccharicrinis carchari]